MLNSLVNKVAGLKDRYLPFILLTFLPIVLGYLLGKAIVSGNYYIMLLIAIAFIGFLILKSDILSISIILFLVFFGNWLETLGLLPGQFNWLAEVIIIALFLKGALNKIIRQEKIQLKYTSVFLLFLSICAISYLLNSASLIHALFFIRLLIRYYILYLAILNLEIDERFTAIICKIVAFLFIIQIPTAIIKLFIYGQGEFAIGTYAQAGGTLSTVLPLIAINFCIAFYFFYKNSRLYLLLALSFIGFGLIGGKKGLIIYIPILMFFLGFFMKDQFRNLIKFFLIGLLIILLTGFFSIKFLKRLNPEYSYGGKVDLQHVVEYYSWYTTASDERQSVGRMSTTKNVFRILREEGLGNILFGFGPGSFIETRFKSIEEESNLPIVYGITALSWLALQVGYVGAAVYLLMFFIILIYFYRFYKREKIPYWKAYGFGMFGFSFIMLIVSISYAPIIIDDLVPMVYFLLIAIPSVLKNNRVFQSKGVY